MIILLTDFGQSEYVGVMKAVIYSINKDAKIVDLCHDISPQKTIEASWVLKNNYKYFPEGATFCCVVDPGVGTERKALAVKTTGYYFVAPDNGLLWETLKEQRIIDIREVPIPPDASSTFHGRDVFAKAAANIALGHFDTSGPKTEEIMQKITEENLSKVERFHIASLTVSGYKVMAARTGYTGEDGFEIYIPDTTHEKPEKALKVWSNLLEARAIPCGLGARDSLRLEAGLWLYGNDIDESINPLEAGLGWTVMLDKDGYFIGQRAIQKMKDEGLKKTLIGLKMEERGIPRHGYPVLNIKEEEIGVVTSGVLSPTLGYGIALAYVPTEYRKRGTEIYIQIRGKAVKGKVVKHRPFYDDSVYGWKRNK